MKSRTNKLKLVVLMCCVLLSFVLTGCQDNSTGNNDPMQQKNLTVESFCEKFNGFWGYQTENDGWEIVNIGDNSILYSTYCAEPWFAGEITEFEHYENTVQITIYDAGFAGDEVFPPISPRDIEVTFISDDDFNGSSLIWKGNNGRHSLEFLGKTDEDLRERIRY